MCSQILIPEIKALMMPEDFPADSWVRPWKGFRQGRVLSGIVVAPVKASHLGIAISR